jgi:hypothetical protein
MRINRFAPGAARLARPINAMDTKAEVAELGAVGVTA